MRVEAELNNMYKLTVCHDGCFMGFYDESDEWEKTFYDDDIEPLVELVSSKYYYKLPQKCYLELYEVLIYEDKIFDNRYISEYNKYSSDTKLKKEGELFYSLYDSDKYKDIRKNLINLDKLKKEREKKLADIKYQEEKKEKELKEYLKLKEKYEN